MSAHHEELAQRIVDEALAVDVFQGFGTDHLVKKLAQAIRQAENDKLEEAAQEFERKPHHWVGPFEIAATIRSLKSKD